MAAPLFFMALLWERFDVGGRSWLRGRELKLGPLRLHTTNLISGAMFVVLGVVFVAYEGTSALSGLYEENGAEDLAYAAEGWVSSFSRSVPDALVLAVVLGAALAAVATAVLRRRRREPRGLTGAKDEGVEEFAEGKRPDRANR
jgi:hypothetical protein